MGGMGAGIASVSGTDVAEGARNGAIAGAIGFAGGYVQQRLINAAQSQAQQQKQQQAQEAQKQQALTTDEAQAPQGPKQEILITKQIKQYGDEWHPNIDVEIFQDGNKIGHIYSRKISETVLFVDEIVVHPDYQGAKLSTLLYGKALEAAGPQITEVHGVPVGSNMPGISNPADSFRASSLAHFGFNEHFMIDNIMVSRRPPLVDIK